MVSSISVAVFLLLIQSISCAHVQDNRVIIGSSVGGFLGLVILILDIICIFELLRSGGRGICSKLVWILIIIFFPIGGLILYCCCGRSKTIDETI